MSQYLSIAKLSTLDHLLADANHPLPKTNKRLEMLCPLLLTRIKEGNYCACLWIDARDEIVMAFIVTMASKG
jgi:hypothetical protein